MEAHEKIYRSKKDIFLNNIIGGFGWSIGATIGLAIIFTILTFVVSRINIIPIFGEFISNIIHEVLQKNPQLIQ